MNYTKTIREYCLQNKGDIFDVSYMGDKYFEMVPYKTLLKILNRLEEDGILTCIAKGVYFINKEGVCVDDAIIERYISNNHGMYGGYTLFNNLGITEQRTEYIEIYTNRICMQTKTIGKYQLIRVDTTFSSPIVEMITLMDCIENGIKYDDVNVMRLHEAIDRFARQYNDIMFGFAIEAMHYHYSSVLTLINHLDRLGIRNNCIAVFEKMNPKRK